MVNSRERGDTVQSLNGQFSTEETHIGLVAASLDLDQTREIAELYNDSGGLEHHQ